MSSESQQVDPYEVVLADLKAKRDQIDAAIQAIEVLRHGPPSLANPAMAKKTIIGGAGLPEESGVDGPGAFLGLTIVDAAIKLLKARRRSLTNAEIVAAFDAGGLILGSEDKLNTVGSVLNRRFNLTGDIVRVGRGTWGLKVWYPNRSFKKEVKGEVAEGEVADPWANLDPNAPSQPSEQHPNVLAK